MSNQLEKLAPTTKELDAYSTAALLALEARTKRGHNTPYDWFLCDYIGEPLPNDPRFRPISRQAPSGQVVQYNNPFTIERSFSRAGTMLNVRHAQGVLSPEDRLAEYFVASVDLRTGETTEWRLEDIRRRGRLGCEVISMDLSDHADVALVSHTTEALEKDPLAAVLAQRRQTSGKICARLVLDAIYGSVFTPVAGPDEPLVGAAVLVQEVNELTVRYDLDLAALGQRSGESWADVIPIDVNLAA